jgi:stress response protein SCP2
VVPDLPPGANVELPGAALGVALDGPFDLSALVLSASGAVAGDADMVFFNQPDAPGVRLRGPQLTVRPEALRRGAERVVVVASPEDLGKAVRTLPPVLLTDARQRPFARFRPPPMPTETVALLVEVYRRAGAWRVRAVGQGYADGLAGLARDFGVDVAEDGAPPAGAPGRPNGGAGGGGGGAAGVLGEVVDRTNAERTRRGLRPLTVDTRLAAAAQAHSADMVQRGFFAHESPDGRQVWDRAVAAGYAYRKVAENIAAGQRSAEEVVRGWMESPGHRANILDGDLAQIGVGRVEGGSYGVYWTQVFGTPR